MGVVFSLGVVRVGRRTGGHGLFGSEPTEEVRVVVGATRGTGAGEMGHARGPRPAVPRCGRPAMNQAIAPTIGKSRISSSHNSLGRPLTCASSVWMQSTTA